MKHLVNYKLIAAAVGMASVPVLPLTPSCWLTSMNRATFAPFSGGTNNGVTNNGAFDTAEVITTGTPTASPFTITFTPDAGPSLVTLGTGTLDTGTFAFHSPVNPLNFFSTLGATINYDFDNNGSIDLTQSYTINLAAFTTPSGFTGVGYAITPTSAFGSVTINGTQYSYASVVANSVGFLFDGQSTSSFVQFQFITTPVPEPSTYALVGVAALGGITWFRRRRSQLVTA